MIWGAPLSHGARGKLGELEKSVKVARGDTQIINKMITIINKTAVYIYYSS